MNQRRIHLGALTTLALLVFASGVLAAPPKVCRRVLPQAGFERERFADPGAESIHTRLGRDGERGLALIVRHRRNPSYPVPAIFDLFRVTPDGHGGMQRTVPQVVSGLTPNAEPTGLVAADIDRDGRDDVVVAWRDYEASKVSADVYMGTSDGFRFAARNVFDGSTTSSAPVAGDFNGDGQVDFVFSLGRETSPMTALLEALTVAPDGEISSLASVPVSAFVHWDQVIVLDQNDDGINDVGLWLSPGRVPTVFWGARANPLKTRTALPIPGRELFGWVARNGHAVLSGGYADPTAPWAGGYRFTDMFEIGPDLSIAWHLPLAEDDLGWFVPALDLDGDGQQDLILGYRAEYPSPPIRPRVLWARSNGAPEVSPPLGALTSIIATLDVDRDGTLDLVTSDYAVVHGRGARQVWDGELPTPFGGPAAYYQPSASVVVGDFDEDGLDDLIGATWDTYTVQTGLSRGDGGFDLQLIEFLPRITNQQPADLDGDGHLDLVSTSLGPPLSVAWGRGDGTFELPASYDVEYPTMADMNADGTVDILGVVLDRERREVLIHPWTLAGRTLVELAPPFTLGGFTSPYVWPADLDGDGRTDVAILDSPYSWGDPRLWWLHARADGAFDRAAPFSQEHLAPNLVAIGLADIDLDGRTDVIATTWPDPRQPMVTTVYRSDGVTLRKVASGPGIRFARIEDVNGDGRPDLIEAKEDTYTLDSYGADIFVGDGLGGFHKAAPYGWSIASGPVGRFRRDGGLDLVRIVERKFVDATIELFPSTGHVKASDEEPPSVDVTLFPVIDTSMKPPRFDDEWQIATVPIDDCDDRPHVTSRVIELFPVDPAARVTFRKAVARTIELFVRPGEEFARDVLLTGPEETGMRALFARGRAANGFAFEHWGRSAGLTSTAALGAGRGPTDRETRSAQRFTFDAADWLTGAFQTHGTRSLTIAVTAADCFGHSGTTRVPFPAARAAALAKICAQSPAPDVLCHR